MGDMALYLVQHGKSLQKEIDPEQGLSEEGRREVERIAATAANYGVRIASIAHSGKKRALQTAEIFAAALNLRSKLSQRNGMKPLDDVVPFSGALKAGDDVMLVGHLPFMERLTSHLITGETGKTVFKFQNGGIVCLDQDLDNLSWHIKWALMPEIG
jgi:phosphohistidine phosphatase